MHLPMKTFEGNLVFVSGGCYAAYRLTSTQYNYIAHAKKYSKRDELGKIIINSKAGHIKILGKPTISSIERDNEEFKKSIKGEMKEEANSYLDTTTAYLGETIGDEGDGMQRYILIKLKKHKKPGIKEAIKSGVSEGIKTIINLFNMEEYTLSLKDLEAYKKSEDELFRRIKNVTRANEMDIEWLNRQPFYRAIGEPRLRSYVDKEGNPCFYTPTHQKIIKNGEVSLSPHKHELLSLADGDVNFENYERYLSVEHIDGRVSYQSFLTISDLPPIVFPNEEWIYGLSKSLSFPVEWCIDMDILNKKRMEFKVSSKRKKTEDQVDNINDPNELPEEVVEAGQEGKKLGDSIGKTRFPHTLTNISFVVASDNLEELRDRVHKVIEYFSNYGEKGIEIQNPVSDQGKLFVEFLPGSTKQLLAYSRVLPLKAILSAMPTADDFIGDVLGFIFGFVGNKPVRIDPRSPALHDKSPAISSTGGLGGGKTFLMKFLVILAALIGGKGIYVDPKGESVNWGDFIPFIKGKVELMTLSGADDEVGMLDPFMIYDIPNKEGKEKEKAKATAYQLATSKICELLDISRNTDENLAVQEACMYAKENKEPCMERVLEYLNGGYKEHGSSIDLSKECRHIYRHLSNYKQFKVASLLFGNGKGRAIDFKKPITILQIEGLSIPDIDKEFNTYDLEEMLSQSIMGLLMKLLEKIAFEDNSTFVDIAEDETWFIKLTKSGAGSINKIRRQGRSLFTALHVIDQNPSGITSGERNQINTKFVYRTEDIDEATSALKFLDLELSKSNLEMVMQMPEHHVLYQDYNGKTELVKVDLIFREFIDAFNTTPKVG